MTWDPKDDIYKQFALSPDRDLQLWEQFVTIRQNDYIKLGQGTQRPPADLILHGSEKVRPKKEWKQVIEDAEFSKLPVYRNHKYEEHFRLKELCPDRKVYEVKKTKLERGIIKVIEHVDCPEYIQKTEKGVLGEPERKACVRLEADFNQYRAKREEQLEKRIKKCDPFKPDIKELVVIGRTPQPPPPPPPILPVISISSPVCPALYAPCGIYALRINNTVLVKSIPNQPLPHLARLQKEPWHEVRTSWTYYLNNPQSRLGEAKMFLQNLGTVSIKYCWQKIQKLIPFIPDTTYEQKFFFNKGENVLNPGQIRVIYFTFLSENPGIFLETWKFNLANICFFDNTTDKLTIQLIGDCAENMKKITSRIDKLQYRIKRKVTQKFAFDLINQVLDIVTGIEHQYYPYKTYLLEAEIFVNKNPLYYYHQTEVQRLKDMYMDMKQEEWNLFIPTWREAVIEKDYEERMSYYAELKKSCVILMRPLDDAFHDIPKQKREAVMLLLGNFADKFFIEKTTISKLNGVPLSKEIRGELKESRGRSSQLAIAVAENRITEQLVQNIFYIRMYEHLANTTELVAAIVGSIDLYRWMDFDFCRY